MLVTFVQLYCKWRERVFADLIFLNKLPEEKEYYGLYQSTGWIRKAAGRQRCFRNH